jgi:hypothetical protein
MQVDVKREILPPGVEHHDEGGLRTEVPSIAGEREKGVGCGLKQEPVDEPWAMDRDGIEQVRKREDHVEVVHG